MADEMEKELATKMNTAAGRNPPIKKRVMGRQMAGALAAGNKQKAARMMRKMG